MAYKQQHQYGYRDALQKGDAEKVIKGEYFDDEFAAIEESFEALPGADGGDISPDAPGYANVVFQDRIEDQQVVSKFTFAVDGQEPLTVENTGIWAGTNYVKYVSADTTWKILPGLDIEGDLNVDGTIDATGDIHTDSNVSVDGNLLVTGNITIDGNVIDGDGNIPDQLPHGSVEGATIRWNDADQKWEETGFLKVPFGADNGDVQVTLTTITPQGSIYNSRGDGTGLSFDIDTIKPIKNKVVTAAQVDLGSDTSRFKDVYSLAVDSLMLKIDGEAIFNKLGGTCGVKFTNTNSTPSVEPVNPSGALSNGTIDIGSSTTKFKGGWFSGGINCGPITATGNISSTGNIIAYKASDERLKDDISPMPLGLIDAIEPSTWKWKSDGRSSGGVVAQQLQKIGLEDWVRESPEGELGVDYEALIGVLIAEVRWLKSQINDSK